MTSQPCSPKVRTSLRATLGPMPLSMPETRYFSMPSRVLGGTTRSRRVLNWSPCWQSYPTAFALDVLARHDAGGTADQGTHIPLSHDLVPRRTQPLVTSLWKVIRFTKLLNRSAMVPHSACRGYLGSLVPPAKENGVGMVMILPDNTTCISSRFRSGRRKHQSRWVKGKALSPRLRLFVRVKHMSSRAAGLPN